MGGRLSFLAATLGLDLAGVVGFYGWPTGPARNDTPAPADMAARWLGPSWGSSGVRTRASLVGHRGVRDGAPTSDVDHRLVTYPDAPHGFFDRKASEFADASEAAWEETLGFIRARTAGRLNEPLVSP